MNKIKRLRASIVFICNWNSKFIEHDADTLEDSLAIIEIEIVKLDIEKN